MTVEMDDWQASDFRQRTSCRTLSRAWTANNQDAFQSKNSAEQQCPFPALA
jgi:hypothetical protein